MIVRDEMSTFLTPSFQFTERGAPKVRTDCLEELGHTEEPGHTDSSYNMKIYDKCIYF